MRQCVLHDDPLMRVERQHFIQQIESFRIRIRKQLLPRNFRLERQRLKVAPRLKCAKRHVRMSEMFLQFFSADLLVDDAVEVFLRRRTENTEDVVQLIQVVFPRENGPVGEHLREDAAHGPDVYRFRVTLKRTTKHSLNRSYFFIYFRIVIL